MNKPKNFNYYLNLFKSKKYLWAIPIILISIVSLFMAFMLPPVYESKATILIEEQQIPPDFVRTTVTGFADQRIQSITQQILSRTKLWEIIKQFELYKDMLDKYTQEEVIEKMRGDIAINTISADMTDRSPRGGRGGLTIAFTVSYRGKNPGQVQKVAGNLSSLYLEQNLRDRQEKAETTTRFLEAELKQLEERIKVVGDQIAKFKQKHEGSLPELKGHNLAQAERLENEIKILDNQIRAANDRRAYLEGQIATVNPDLPLAGQEAVMDPRARLYMLQVDLSSLGARLSPDHPDIRKLKREIEELEKLVSVQGGVGSTQRQKLSLLRTELASKQGTLSPEHPEIKKLQREIARLEQEKETSGTPTVIPPVPNPNNPAFIGLKSQIQAIDNEIAMQRKQQADMRDKLRMYRERLEQTPTIEQEYAALNREYENAHNKYMEVMNKLLTAKIAEGMEEHQKAEKFTLIDPASFPEKPVSPNRLLIAAAGLLLGLASGVGMVLLTDQLDHTVKDANDINLITDLPVLGSISRIQTPEELQWLKRRRWIVAAATCFSILLLIILVHFIYRDFWVMMAQLMRFFNKYL